MQGNGNPLASGSILGSTQNSEQLWGNSAFQAYPLENIFPVFPWKGSLVSGLAQRAALPAFTH